MTPDTPSPAAENEGEVRLTEAERTLLLDVAYAYANPFESDNPTPEWLGLAATVERIIAERVRVVEGERDAWRFDHSIVEHWQERAESAEAARAEIVAKVEALADEHEAVMDACVPMTDRDERESGRKTVRRLRALLGGEGA